MTKIPLCLVSTAGKTTEQIAEEAIMQLNGKLGLLEEQNTKYTIYIDDNFHYMDESYRYELDQYNTWEDAVKVCKQIVRSNIDNYIAEGIPLLDLYDHYVAVGDDPWVSPTPDGQNHFSAWTYAKEITNN